MNTFGRLVTAFACGVLLPATFANMAVSAEQATTWSFGAGGHVSCPNTITRDKETIAVDLSALPEGAEVFRAVLRCRRQTLPGWQHETDRVVVAPAAEPERPLRLPPPRYASLDATASVTTCAKEGKETLELVVKSFPGWKPESLRLDASFTGGAAKAWSPRLGTAWSWWR